MENTDIIHMESDITLFDKNTGKEIKVETPRPEIRNED